MKKLLIIASQYPNEVNSVRGIFVKEQAIALKEKYNIKVLSTQNTGSKSVSSYCSDGIDITYIQYSFRKFIFSPLKYYFAVRKTLNKILIEYNPDIIHIHDYQHIPDIFVLSFLLKKMISKTIVTFHNSRQLFDSPIYMRLFYKSTLKYVLAKYNKIIVVSKKLNYIISPYCSKDNVIIIGNGVEIDFPIIKKENFKKFLPQPNKAYQIISVGNLVKTKGFDLLIHAVSNLNKTGCDVELSIIGRGIEKDNLYSLIIENKMEDKIHLLGVVDHDIVMNLYSYYDAFVLPSWSETFGIVYLEAMLSKIPVIGVKGEGIDGIIKDGINGFLVERKNVDELEKKIKIVIEFNNIDQIIESGYKEVISNHLLENTIKRIEKIYEK